MPKKPHILVTRPAHQASAFISQLSAMGVCPVAFPTIEIVIRTTSLEKAELAALSASTLWIFTSANAVTGASHVGLFNNLPVPKIACIGDATASALRHVRTTIDYAPRQNGTSEDLLAHLQSQGIDTCTVSIVRGNGGRETLKKQLQLLGCEVHYVPVYQRRLPRVNADTLQLGLSLLPSVICITSNQGLQNLIRLIPVSAHQKLFASDLIVNSERCAIFASQLGFTSTIEVAHPPGDNGQIACIKRLLTEVL